MDRAHQQTDSKISTMNGHINAFYNRKSREIQAKMVKFSLTFKTQADKLLKDYHNSKTREEKQEAERKYKAFFKDIIRSESFKELSDFVADEMYLTNQQATSYINSQLADIYTLNFNYMGDELVKGLNNYPFIPAKVEEVEEYGDIHKQIIDEKKDKRWNKENLIKSITVGSLIMLPIGRMFQRTAKITVNKNLNIAHTHSEGMASYSENLGRLDGMYRANDFGFHIMKKWNATKDNRTRDSHRELDGKVIELNEEFKPGLSQPRDENAEKSEICRCRCWLTQIIDGISRNGASMAAREGTVSGTYESPKSFIGTKTVNVPNMTYTEWAKWREK